MNKNKLMTFTVRFLVAAPAVFFFFVTQDLHLGYATVPVALVSCVLVVLVISLLEPRFQHVIRIRQDSDRRIYINDIPYYRFMFTAIGVLGSSAIVFWAMASIGKLVLRSF